MIPIVKRLIGETPVGEVDLLDCTCMVLVSVVSKVGVACVLDSRVDVKVTFARLVPKASVGDANLVTHITPELKFVLVYEHPVTWTILKCEMKYEVCK